MAEKENRGPGRPALLFPRMRHVSVTVEMEQYLWVSQRAKAQDVYISEVIREAIAEKMEREDGRQE